MSTQLEDLFHDLEAPAMSVSPNAVVAAGQHKVRRRRALWGAGTGALAAAAAVAIAVGTALPNSSSTSPMPAHTPSGVHASTSRATTTPTATQSFFQTDGGAPDRVRDPFPAYDGPQATYQAVRIDGQLRIRRIVKTSTTLLTPTVHYADGGTASWDGHHTIVVRPVPAKTWTASLTGGTSAMGGTADTGVTLSDGTTAAMFVVEHRFTNELGSQIYWLTADNSGGSSRGDTPALGEITGAPIGNVTMFYFATTRVCGWISTQHGGGSVSLNDMPDGRCTTSGADLPDKQPGTAWWIRVVPGPITDVEITSGHNVSHPKIIQTPLSGSDLVALSVWATVPTAEDAKLPILQSARWIGPDGKLQTYHQDAK